ncbi:head vertex assembly chaperone [Morganella phage vB_Mm5]
MNVDTLVDSLSHESMSDVIQEIHIKDKGNTYIAFIHKMNFKGDRFEIEFSTTHDDKEYIKPFVYDAINQQMLEFENNEVKYTNNKNQKGTIKTWLSKLYSQIYCLMARILLRFGHI